MVRCTLRRPRCQMAGVLDRMNVIIADCDIFRTLFDSVDTRLQYVNDRKQNVSYKAISK